jgi:hypothetical protein
MPLEQVPLSRILMDPGHCTAFKKFATNECQLVPILFW